MLARQIMTKDVISVGPESTVRDVARLLIERRISGVPVVDGDSRVLGMISEADLIFRVETGARRPRSWWLSLFAGGGESAADFIKSHSRHVSDLMTRDVVWVEEETPVADVAKTLEERHVRRVPVLRQGRLVGIISRADLVRMLALSPEPLKAISSSTDEAIQEQVASALRAQPWAGGFPIKVIVTNGVVHLWGLVGSGTEEKAIRVLAEEIPGVERVESHLELMPEAYYGGI